MFELWRGLPDRLANGREGFGSLDSLPKALVG
jgi:hypothetical protein